MSPENKWRVAIAVVALVGVLSSIGVSYLALVTGYAIGDEQGYHDGWNAGYDKANEEFAAIDPKSAVIDLTQMGLSTYLARTYKACQAAETVGVVFDEEMVHVAPIGYEKPAATLDEVRKDPNVYHLFVFEDAKGEPYVGSFLELPDAGEIQSLLGEEEPFGSIDM